MAPTRPRKVWLIRWEWAGDHAAVEQPIAAMLPPQTSDRRVRQLVEILYAASQYAPDEMLAQTRPRAFNPYPARYDQLDGVTWTGAIYCGHNPWLYARHARVWPAGDGSGRVEWEDEPRPPSPLARHDPDPDA